MASLSTELMVRVISKIQLFKGLSANQVNLVLSACQHQVLEEGEILCLEGAPSNEIYILAAGELFETGAGGMQEVEILPVDSVAEADFVIGQPYSTTIKARKISHIFAIPRSSFERFLRRDFDLHLKIYKNVARILAARMGKGDVAAVEHKLAKRHYLSRITALERQLKQQVQKTEVVLDLLASRGGMSREGAELHVAEKLKGLVPRILVVDDEPEFRRFVKDVLNSFSVVEAANGQEALDILRDEPMDLIIADIRMPEMDGCALLTNLRSLYPGLRVMAVSGHLEAEVVQNYSFDGFIDKPVRPQRLQEMVENTLSQGNE